VSPDLPPIDPSDYRLGDEVERWLAGLARCAQWEHTPAGERLVVMVPVTREDLAALLADIPGLSPDMPGPELLHRLVQDLAASLQLQAAQWRVTDGADPREQAHAERLAAQVWPRHEEETW